VADECTDMQIGTPTNNFILKYGTGEVVHWYDGATEKDPLDGEILKITLRMISTT